MHLKLHRAVNTDFLLVTRVAVCRRNIWNLLALGVEYIN
jgi:hypothetical protein